MFNRLFDNSRTTLKIIAAILLYLGLPVIILASILCSITYKYGDIDGFNFELFVIILFGGSLSIIIFSMILYTFGDIAEDVHTLRQKLVHIDVMLSTDSATVRNLQKLGHQENASSNANTDPIVTSNNAETVNSTRKSEQQESASSNANTNLETTSYNTKTVVSSVYHSEQEEDAIPKSNTDVWNFTKHPSNTKTDKHCPHCGLLILSTQSHTCPRCGTHIE